jgi:hypothetical protein
VPQRLTRCPLLRALTGHLFRTITGRTAESGAANPSRPPGIQGTISDSDTTRIDSPDTDFLACPNNPHCLHVEQDKNTCVGTCETLRFLQACDRELKYNYGVVVSSASQRREPASARGCSIKRPFLSPLARIPLLSWLLLALLYGGDGTEAPSHHSTSEESRPSLARTLIF